jgi:V8-like Glu-specific endopeptidase
MELSSVQVQNLIEALIAAFYKKANLAQMVRFSLNENLDVIAGGADLGEIAFNLAQWAEAHERIEELLIGAREQNPGNGKLKAISQELLATTLDVTSDQLESIVQQSVNFADIEPWLEQIRYCSLAVCRIEFPAGTVRGSGFLLGSRVVITNYHVVEDIINHPSFKDDLVARFNYKVDATGKKPSVGIEQRLTGTSNGIFTSSPAHKLDYILLHLDISKNSHQANSALKPLKYTFTHGEPLGIIQHPLGNPQKIALGSISHIPAPPNRIHYTTNTLKGSSGSPCVNSDGAVVALHQGEHNENGNKGIPFSVILEDLRRKSLLSLLDV